MNRCKQRIILSILLCFTTLFLLTACGAKRKESENDIIAIEPQIIFSQNGITITADSFKFVGGRFLGIYATVDNDSDLDIERFSGYAYVGGVGAPLFSGTTKDLPAGTKGAELELTVDLDELSIFGVTKDMIGGELPLFLGASFHNSSEEIFDFRSIMLPAAEAELPSLDIEGLRMFAYSGDEGDFTLSYIGERKNEDGGLDLYISVANNSDKPLTRTGSLHAINGNELRENKYSSVAHNIAPDSRVIGILDLSAEECEACGVDCFDDIDTIRGFLSGGDVYMLEYRESDAHPTGEAVITDRGNIRVNVTEVATLRVNVAEVAESQETLVALEVRVDMTTLASNDLISDIENMTFVNGCGEKFTLAKIKSTIDGNDLCYSGTMNVRNIDDNLSLCFLVIGDDVWLLG